MEHDTTSISMADMRQRVRNGDWMIYMTVQSVAYELSVVGPVDRSVYYVMPTHISGPPEASEQTVAADVFTADTVYEDPDPDEPPIGHVVTAERRAFVRRLNSVLRITAQRAACDYALNIAYEDVMAEVV